MKTNTTCNLEERECWEKSQNSLHILGTGPTIYKPSQRQINVGVSEVPGSQVSQTWNKQRGVTVKDIMLNFPDVIHTYLDYYYGVQVSYCTGIARRVPLRTLIADLIPHFCINSNFDPDLVESKIRRECLRPKDPFFDRKTLSLINQILQALGPTGLDLTEKYICVAWPFEGFQTSCFKIPLEGENSWAKFLEDSQDFATFAYITMECFETENFKCRSRAPEACQHIHLLETAVFRAQQKLNQSPLQDEEVCFFPRLEGMFWVKVLKEHISQPAYLFKLETILSMHRNIRHRVY